MFTCLASINLIQSLTVLSSFMLIKKAGFLFAFFQKCLKREFSDKKIHFEFVVVVVWDFLFPQNLCDLHFHLISLKLISLFEVRIIGGRNTYLEHKYVADCFSPWILYAS